MNWEVIVPAIGAALAMIVVFWRRWGKMKDILKEIAEALVVLSAAIEDNNITKEEIQSIAKEFGDIIESAMNLTRR